MSLPRIDAILIPSREPERLAAFYRAAFELPEPRPDGEDHLGFPLENGYLGIERALETDRLGRGGPELWFRVEDVRAKHAELLELGARSLQEPDSECSPGETLARLLDPEGNVLGLVGP